MHLERPTLVALALALGLALACGGEEASGPGSTDAAQAESTAAPASPKAPSPAVPAAARPHRNEKPLPAFEGRTLDGGTLSISSLIGKRIVIFFFNPTTEGAPVAIEALRRIAALRTKNNFEVVGVAMGASPTVAKTFAEENHIDFPVIDDSNADIARRFGLRAPMVLLGVDSEGYVVFGLGHFDTEDEHGADLIEDAIRTSLRLPRLERKGEPELGTHPMAPTFRAPLLDGDTPFDLAAHRGEPLVLIFFLHTCPHCHEALRFLKKTLAGMPEESRPYLIGIEVSGRAHDVRERLREDELDFFPVAFDPHEKIASAYGSQGAVPDIILIDREGRIAARVRGWRSREDPPLMRMRLATLAGTPVPMLLRAKGYSGSEVCGVCHQPEYETWQFTRHAYAFDTLVKHGADADPECVGCHVVGYGAQGGFESATTTGDLEQVGCESCHGRGGPHLTPGFVANGSYESLCLGCHDEKHSLGFAYATFLPRVSHAANAPLLALPLEEKRRRLAELGKPREALLPIAADYVGSDACRSCHEAEFATWSKSGHAHAVATLAKTGESGKQDCLRCHTTGFGKPGGFPAGAAADGHPDLGRVGCESCHGPGSNHVGEDAAKSGTIVSLGDKCDSCVILLICGSCHDDANDPGFEFEVKEKIEAQRHGTTTPRTSARLDPSRLPPGALAALAFRLADAGS